MKKTTLLILLSLGATAHGAEVVKLENRALQLELGRTPAPFIEKIVHKDSGQAVVANPANKNLFSILFAPADGGLTTIESSQAIESSMSAESSGKVTLRYGKFPAGNLTVEVTVMCSDDNPETFWSIRIDNKTGRQIKAVRFPQVLAVPAIGNAQDDGIVLPAFAGTLIENPAANWKNGQSVTLDYPGNLSAQFIAYQDRTAGLYLTSRDTSGYPMSFTVFKQPDGYRFWHEFKPVTSTTYWQNPYPVALGVTQGTWHDTADQYKNWAAQQSWCAKKLAERTDIPTWLKDGPDVHVCEVRTYNGARAANGSYYPKIQEHLRTFRDKIDGPVVAMLAGWENHRRWTGGDYFPIFDATNAKSVIAALRQDGFRPFFYLSGGFYTFWNEGADGGEISAAQQFLPAFVRDGKTGKPKEYVLNESNPAGDWKRHSFAFCVNAPETEKFFCDLIGQAHTLGVDVLQLDQTTSGAGDGCYSTTHNHLPGPGLYQSEGFRALLDAMRQHGKSLTPDFALLHEEVHEQLIPHLDGFHVREYYEKRWYRGYPGATGIPLFSYLYHEYSLGYGGDSAMLSKDNNRWHVRCHAINLVTGRTPGGSIWSSQQSMYDAHPDQIAMIRNHSRLLKTRAKDCLMLGRMLHPVELKMPTLTIAAPAQRGGKWAQETMTTPAVLTSSWLSPSGRIGHLFVNIAESPQPVEVNLDTRNTSAARSYDAEIYRSTTGEIFKPLWQNEKLPKKFSTKLEPGEAVFVELHKSGQ
ncbi:MAG: DUF6259 domain-containing protein [Verrucomicrobiota bacterium]